MMTILHPEEVRMVLGMATLLVLVTRVMTMTRAAAAERAVVEAAQRHEPGSGDVPVRTRSPGEGSRPPAAPATGRG